ncbi:hypothetical protein CCICO_00955 [Corynebacterium ciconiae DSM 44920]|uniref:lysylphosphatidylglycerol synthase transmembrane domain-containing protein n=1 Tax=Corynebacterium ciconiae TaxID=227319 RepID=UPI000364E3AF|nr:YbhN family protein [Corynebacterium ciconiae]WKD60249.1 hypothetical protein CCICO_00955 [Corynebacterium ciconiae DSM 44920]
MLQFLRNPWVRWLFPLVVLGIVLFIFRDNLPFIAEGFMELDDMAGRGMALAIISSILALVAMAEVMYVFMRAGKVKVSRLQANALTFGSNAWSTSFPGGPAFATVLQYQIMNRWGAGPAISTWFLVLSSTLSTLWLVALGVIAIIFLGASLSLGSLLLTLAVLLALSALTYWASNNPDTLKRLLKPITSRTTGSINHHIDQLKAAHMGFGTFLYAAAMSFLNWVFDIVTLVGAVWAVTYQLPDIYGGENKTTIAGIALAFVTAKIAGTVQVTPGGLGPVEAAMMGTLVATGMTAAQAFSAVFIYRLISLGLITILGWIVYFFGFSSRGIRPQPEIKEHEEPVTREGRTTSTGESVD